jgi:hypothetical protein
MGYGIFGMSADHPYVSKKTLGCYIQGNRLNQSGALEFEILAEYCEDGVFPRLPPDSEDIFGLPYTFSLVFWEVKQPVPDRPLTVGRGAEPPPISSYYDFYKLLLTSSSRMEGGTAANYYIPLSFSTSGSMGVGTWHLSVEACSIIKHDVQIDDQSRGMSIISDSFRDPYGHQVIGHLSKSDDK